LETAVIERLSTLHVEGSRLKTVMLEVSAVAESVK